ncbi:hypothetical protein KU43P_09270 [Pseudomonas sp. KU43P]|nr:hypothetical protein KU43P_09270 [Pseudomonas sp. KU43P]
MHEHERLLSVSDDGWLCIDTGDRPEILHPIRFSFRYLAHTEDRVHYNVGCASTSPTADRRGKIEDGKLGYSVNAYVGFYEFTMIDKVLGVSAPWYMLLDAQATTSFWKIEVLGEWDGSLESAQEMDIHLRDHSGRRIAAYRESPCYPVFLNVEKGEILTFQLRNIILL